MMMYRRLYICTAVLQALYAAAYARPCTHLCTTQSEHFGEAITGKRVMLEADSWTFDSLSSANFFLRFARRVNISQTPAPPVKATVPLLVEAKNSKYLLLAPGAIYIFLMARGENSKEKELLAGRIS